VAIGYEIALVPSPVTVSSIQKMFHFTPRGIPATWRQGSFHEETVTIRAEKFCLSCHRDASLGGILGTVKVRSYLSHLLERWWLEVRLTAWLSLGKILIHTTILFFLLKIRLEPLLSLRSVVASLAKSGADLSHRATLKSEDEFAELAQDLNHFLDRLCLILEEVGQVLKGITALNLRLEQINSQIDNSAAAIRGLSQRALKEVFSCESRLPFLSLEWKTSMQLALAASSNSHEKLETVTRIGARMDGFWAQFDETSVRLEKLHLSHQLMAEGLIEMNTELRDFDHYLYEMKGLEEKMEHISDAGQRLLKRLTGQ